MSTPLQGDTSTVPDVRESEQQSGCVGPQCRCEHRPVGRARWCCDACRGRHKRAQPAKRASRKSARRDGGKRVAGVDGETIDNRYVLLVAAEDEGEVWRAENAAGLSTTECLRFLTSLPSDVIYWGFAFRYDVNMMLGDVPPHLIERLHIEGECFWGAYRIEYHGKRLLVSKRKGSGAHRKTVASFTLWDMFPWVQTSFVRWLTKWEIAKPTVIHRIDAMKNLRSSFTPRQRPAIRRYCTEECQLLATGARMLMERIDATGLPVRQYHSPASVAKAAMNLNKTVDYRVDLDSEIAKRVDEAYHGGRAEISELGLIDGPFYAYDLNSAYPAMAVDLPCLAHGSWVHHDEAAMDWMRDHDWMGMSPYMLCKVSWRAGQRVKWGPFPLQPKVGSLRYPTSGSGWYWGAEVIAALRHPEYNVRVRETYQFLPECTHRPFAYLRDLYELRKQRQAEGDESQIIYKLALNSTYGALAEHPHRRKGKVTPPKHRCMMWAGLICAGVRAQLLDVLDDDVIFLATDCAVSRRPLHLDVSDELGAWGHDPDHDVYDRMLVFGTGQYFKSVGGDWTSEVKTRGFNPREIDREALERLWLAEGRAGVYKFNRQRFIGYGTALQRIGGMWPPGLRFWRTFVTETVAKRFDMTPRRTWETDDPMDGRTVSPTLTLHRATEKADKAALAHAYAQYERSLKIVERMRKPLPNGKPNPFLALAEHRMWNWALAITGMSGSDDHGRLFDQQAEPVAWGDDF